MSVELPDSIIGAYLEYFDEITKALESDPDRKETALILARFLRSEYSFDILRVLAQTDSIHKEICFILKGFEPRNVGFFFKALTVEELILAVKFYVISWATLFDMLAGLINKVFDLGFADADVKFDVIRRNKHVLNSDLPAIFEKYGKALNMKEVKRHRNEIVHRGRIMDEEVKIFYEAQSVLHAQRYSFLRSNHISEEEYKKESAEQTKILFELASRKKSECEAHYKATLGMVADVLRFLGRRAIELYKAKAI